MNKFKFLKRILLDTQGAAAVEYGLILAMIVLAMMAGLGNFATNVMRQWNYVSNEAGNAMN